MGEANKDVYEFDSFRLDPQERLLLQNGNPVSLTPKAFDTLVLLVQNSGHLLLKDELMKSLWPGSFVEEANLSQNVSILRRTLGEKRNQQRYIATVPGKGYRFVAAVKQVTQDANGTGSNDLLVRSYSHSRVVIEEKQEDETPALSAATMNPERQSWFVTAAKLKLGLAALVIAAGALLVIRVVQRSRDQALKPFSSIVIADFTNTTGDSVFNDTLRRALTVDLEQSPFLRVLSDQQIAQALRMMERTPNQPLSPELARELCHRVGGNAVLNGAIANIGTRYVISLAASNCGNGNSLGNEQVRVDSKDHVLEALDAAAGRLRARLGESPASVEKYDTSVEQATTRSLEALHAYSAGLQVQNTAGHPAAVVLFQRAIELDPNFAMAYARLANAYENMGESQLAAANVEKAFSLRGHANERERLYIETHYHQVVTGDLEKNQQIYLEWLQIYPRDDTALGNLSVDFVQLGDYVKALSYARAGLQAAPNEAAAYIDLAQVLIALNRFDEADAVLKQMQARKLYLEEGPLLEYQIAFLNGDDARMETLFRETLPASSDSDSDLLLAQSDTEAYRGRLSEARALNGRVVHALLQRGAKENAATAEADIAVWEAECGNAARARKHSAEALRLTHGRTVRALAALALARSGAASQAERLSAELHQQFPSDTLLNRYWLPCIRAAVELGRGRPAQALEALRPTAAYELGVNSAVPSVAMYPAYLRGLAFLATGDAVQAITEFQTLIQHRGVSANSVIMALAHLKFGRAVALSGDRAKANSAYHDFLSLWKDADPDIPILQRAKMEYAELRQPS